MANALSAADLKKAVGSPALADLSALQKALERFVGKDDYEEQVSLLGDIHTLALTAKNKVKDATKKEEKGSKDKETLAKLSKLADHVDDVVNDALAAKKEAQAALEKEEAAINPLKSLQRARLRSEKAPLYFALALGRFSGLAVVKRYSTAARKKAIEARTVNNGAKVNGKLLKGRVYGESGKLVFELGLSADEVVRAPGGLARNLRNTILKQTDGTRLKVLVRGGGKDIDDEADAEEMTDFGTEESGDDEGDAGKETDAPTGRETPTPTETTAGPEPDEETVPKVSAAFEKALSLLQKRLDAAIAGRRGDVDKMRAVLGYAREKAEGGDESGGLAGLKALTKLLDAADSAPNNGLDPERLKEWAGVRDSVVGEIRAFAAALAKAEIRDQTKSAAISEVQLAVGRLNLMPTSREAIEALEAWVVNNPTIDALEESPPELHAVSVREPLLQGLKVLKS
jgi:hypothetical protein